MQRVPVKLFRNKNTPAPVRGARWVPLSRNYWTLVDITDYDYITRFKWYVYERNRGTCYALRDRDDGRGTERMHRVLMEAPRGDLVDHKNTNGLDNRRSNLRFATGSNNLCNAGKKKTNTSGYKGVSWSKSDRRWRATITINRKWYFLGNFKTKRAAALAYARAAKQLHGDFARIR